MFTFAEMDMGGPIIEGFKEVLLTGSYDKCIGYIRSQTHLKKVFVSHFDKSQTAEEIMHDIKHICKENLEQKLLFCILMLWRDENFYQPWVEMCEAFEENSLLYSYECLFIYYNLIKKELSRWNMGELKVDVYRKWERIKDLCLKNELWIEGFYATYYQASISDEYLVNFITLLDYNIDKLGSTPVLQQFKSHRLIESSRKLLNQKLSNEKIANWIQAILYEMDGDMDKSIEYRIKEYRKHKKLMVLVRKLYSIGELNKLNKFLEEELKVDPLNQEIKNSLKRSEILKIASGFEDKKISKMMEDAVFKGSEVPSGERLNELYLSLNNTKMRKLGVEIFNLFQQLFPLDHEVCKYYGKILEAHGQIEEAFGMYDLMLMSGYDEKRAIADIRIIVISALMHDRLEYAERVLSKLDEMHELQEEIDKLKKKKELTALHRLYIQVKKELSELMSLYIKIMKAKDEDKLFFKQAFKLICAKVGDYDCIGILDDLLDQRFETFLEFEEVKNILNITAIFSKKIFPLKLYMIDQFINSVESSPSKYQHILKVASKVDIVMAIIFQFIDENKDIAFANMKETFEKLKANNKVHDTLKTCIDLLYDTKDNRIRKFVMLLMVNLFNFSKNIKEICINNNDKEQSKKLIVELSNIYLIDLNKGTSFHVNLGFDLFHCSYIEEAKYHFAYAMNNLSEEEKGRDTSILMYHICDLLLKMDEGIEIELNDYKRKSFFAQALSSIVQNDKYSDYVSKYLLNHKESKNETITMISIFKAVSTGDYDKVREGIESIGDNHELYEACKIQLSNFLGGKDIYLEKAAKSQEIAYLAPIEEEVAASKEECLEEFTVDEFIKTFDSRGDMEKLTRKLLQFVPIIADKILTCELMEADLDDQYKAWSTLIDRHIGSVEVLSTSALNNRSNASLKAAVAARALGKYDKFFKYLNEYCEAELERLIKDQKGYTYQAALSYEAHLIWYAQYRYLKELKRSIDKSDKKLSNYHMAFFKAYALIGDISTLQQNIVYMKKIHLFLYRTGYRFITAYRKDFQNGKEGILNDGYSFAMVVEKVVKIQDVNEKKASLDEMIHQIKKMEEVAKQQFFREDMYNIHAFINSLMYICTEEAKKLENKPVMKVRFLNQKDIHTKMKDNGERNKLLSSFHFIISNEGKARADEFSCTFRVKKGEDLLGTPYIHEKQTLREGEQLSIGFQHVFESEGELEIEVEVKHSGNEFQNFHYEVEIKNNHFEYQRIGENTYPTSPIDDKNKFFGRKAIIHRMEDCLYDDSDGTTFMIYGLRRVGKTSLLNYLENMMKDKFYPIQCDCQNIFDASNTSQLVYQLFVENIVYGLTDDYGIDIEMPSEEDFEQRPLRQLKRFFMNAEKKIGDKSLLLLIDEFDEVVKKVEDGIYSAELFDFIRTKMQHSNKSRFIIAGGEYLLNSMKKKALKISDTAKPLEVGFLEREEAREMIEKPLKIKGIQCLPEAVERILMITCCHPYFLTAIGNGMVELLNKERERYVIYPDDVEYVSDKLIDMTQKSMYEHFWNSLDSGYKKLVVAIVAEQMEYYDDFVDMDRLYERMKELHSANLISISLYKDKVRAIVNELMAGRILSNENKDDLAVRISVEQLRRWTRRWKNVDEVLNEIQGGAGMHA